MKFAFRCIYWILYSEWNTLPVSGYISWKDTFGTCFLGMTSWVQVFQVAVQLSFCIRYIKDVKFLRKQMLPTHTVFITSCLSEVPPYTAHSENLLIVVSLEWSEHCSSHELERRIFLADLSWIQKKKFEAFFPIRSCNRKHFFHCKIHSNSPNFF